MVNINVSGNNLRVTLNGWERVWALKSQIDVPLENVERVFIDPSLSRTPEGFKAPGSYWPGKIAAGTYRKGGSKSFWSVRNPAKAVIIDLDGSEFSRLVLEVAEPERVRAEIESAIK